MNSQVIEVDSLKVVHLEPGDCLFIKFASRLSDGARQNIKEMILKALPQLEGDGNRVLILEEGEEIGVIRPK